MIIKFFKKNNEAGILNNPLSSIDYLLNERVIKGTARVLKGDENLTRAILKSFKSKNPACVGCLSFSEKDLSQEVKDAIMQDFENTLLTPEMQGRYNVLWVEHIDKGRLELNFVIPSIDLKSKKVFTPYYHPTDFKKIDLWGDFVNLKHNLTNPKDPTREQNLKDINHNSKKFNDHKALDNHFKELTAKGLFNNRDELINYIKSDLCDYVEITRQGENYFSLKFKNEKKATRYKGGIYQNGEYGDICREIIEKRKGFAESNGQANAERINELRKQIDTRIEYKAKQYREKHAREIRNDKGGSKEFNHLSTMEISSNISNSLHNSTNTSAILPNATLSTETMGKERKHDNNTKELNNANRQHGKHLYNNNQGLNNATSNDINRFAERKRSFERRERAIKLRKLQSNYREQQAHARARQLNEQNERIREHKRAVENLERAIKQDLPRKIRQRNNKLRQLSLKRLKRAFERFSSYYDLIKTRFNKLRDKNQQCEHRRDGVIRTLQDEIANGTGRAFERSRDNFKKGLEIIKERQRQRTRTLYR
ncbi:relaxase/mobilization nuclease domain-containing protein [Campylobacter upsaliensis]|nr:relaxase/mobilization nuclease domain-containing protein [Campylobacter upsaliensis]